MATLNRPRVVLPSSVQPAPLPEVVNHTSWPAQYFQHVDPKGEVFHVMVCRISYDLRGMDHSSLMPPEPCLFDPEEQAPLCESDEYIGEPSVSSTVMESDFAPYKPMCDVLVVNASGHAPGGGPQTRWPVGLHFGRPGIQAAIDKKFMVCGPRLFERDRGGLRLSEPQPATEVPLCYELAAGGPNLVPIRGELEARARDTVAGPGQREAAAKCLAKLPEPHLPNPIGAGLRPEVWSELGLPLASPSAQISGPQIEAWNRPFRGEDDYPVVGLGPIGRWWQPRLARAGTHDQAWREAQWPLSPKDHDYRYWNCAPDDQQIDYPEGGEVMTLVNLLPGHPQVAFTLPRQALQLLVRLGGGPMALAPMHIDTVIVDVAGASLHLVRRACVSARQPLRKLELGTWGDDARVAIGPAAGTDSSLA